MKGLFDTSLPQHWSATCYQEYCFDIAKEHFPKILHIIFNATALILNANKAQKVPVAMVFRKASQELIAAAICQYFPNEDPNVPGNFSLVWTFDEADIPSNAIIQSLDNAETHTFFRAVAGSKWNIEFESVGALIGLCNVTLNEIKKWLDENATESGEIGVEAEDVMIARVAVENGEKVYSIEPAPLIKQLIKNDAAIEK